MVVARATARMHVPRTVTVPASEATGRDLYTVMGADGGFSFAGATAASYRVQVTLAGFPSSIAEHVVLKRNRVTDADIALRLHGDPSTIIVTLGAPIIVPRP
jgi:hypothetical protein